MGGRHSALRSPLFPRRRISKIYCNTLGFFPEAMLPCVALVIDKCPSQQCTAGASCTPDHRLSKLQRKIHQDLNEKLWAGNHQCRDSARNEAQSCAGSGDLIGSLLRLPRDLDFATAPGHSPYRDMQYGANSSSTSVLVAWRKRP